MNESLDGEERGRPLKSDQQSDYHRCVLRQTKHRQQVIILTESRCKKNKEEERRSVSSPISPPVFRLCSS